MDLERLAALGVFDPDASDRDDQVALLEQLVALGATEAELAAASDTRMLGVLALELAMRSPGPRRTLADVAAEAGIDRDRAERFWRALGFGDAASAPPALGEDDVDLFRLTALADSLLGPSATLAMARLMGTMTARLAETIVDAFRSEFEVPERAAGTPYSEIVGLYAALTRDALPRFGDAIVAVFRRHLMVVASGSWSIEEHADVARRDLAVGFIDLVGYTAHTATLPPERLASLVTVLEDTVTDLAARHGCRVVKLIGDGAMFVGERAPDACELALTLLERFAADPAGLPLRAALACGPVVSLHGDYFGDVVNTAARLLTVASASELVVESAVAERVRHEFAVEAGDAVPLKGVAEPVRPFRVTRAAGR